MEPLPRRLHLLPRFSARLALSYHAASRLVRSLRPDVIVGLGGFTSVPVGIAASWHGVPLVLLEQNIVPGRATSFLSRLADEICVSFAETRGSLRTCGTTIVTGNPVRASVLQTTEGSPRSTCSDTPNRQTLLILGGSQGAAGVNSMVLSTIGRLGAQLSGWRIVHQTGERDAARIRAGYRQLGMTAEVAAYYDDLPARYRDAQIVISRAGATTLAELACCGLPAILIPYPQSTKNHQQKNAEHFACADASRVVTEGSGAAYDLELALQPLVRAEDRRGVMSAAMRRLARPDAAAAVANIVLRHCRGVSAAERNGEKTAA